MFVFTFWEHEIDDKNHKNQQPLNCVSAETSGKEEPGLEWGSPELFYRGLSMPLTLLAWPFTANSYLLGFSPDTAWQNLDTALLLEIELLAAAMESNSAHLPSLSAFGQMFLASSQSDHYAPATY